jgi:hypothetical protein
MSAEKDRSRPGKAAPNVTGGDKSSVPRVCGVQQVHRPSLLMRGYGSFVPPDPVD